MASLGFGGSARSRSHAAGRAALALIALMVASPTWRSSASPAGKELAGDAFDSGLDRWVLESPEQIEIRDEPGTTNRLLQLTPKRGGFVHVLLAGAADWRDVRFEGRFQFPTRGDGYLGFLYNHQRHGERADSGCIYVKSNGSYVRVSPHYDGNPSWRLYEEFRTDLEGDRRIQVGTWYRFRLDVRGSLAELYIEDMRSPVVRFDLFPQDRGALGLEARPGGGEPVWVDDVQVTRLPSALPAPAADALTPIRDATAARPTAVTTPVVWEVQGPVALDEHVGLDPPELPGDGWRELAPDRRGMLVTGLVTRYRSADNDGAYLRARFEVGGDGAEAPRWLAVSSANRLDVWLNGYYRGTVAPESYVWADFLATRRGARIPIAPSAGPNELILRVHGERFAGGGLYLALTRPQP